MVNVEAATEAHVCVVRMPRTITGLLFLLEKRPQ